MMRPTYSAIQHHAAGGKPAIVFVPTRKHVRLTALDMLTSAAADGDQHRCARTCMHAHACKAGRDDVLPPLGRASRRMMALRFATH
jgi:hypothetical protein